MSSPKPKSTFTPPPQAELKPTPILEDVASLTATNKKRANRQTLRASYLTAPDTPPGVDGSGVTLA